MAKLQVIVDMVGTDPFGIRSQCEEYCREHLLGEPFTDDPDTLELIADGLEDAFLRTIDPATTGADRLMVSVLAKE